MLKEREREREGRIRKRNMCEKERGEREKGDEKEIERECGGNMQNISCHTWNELYRKK